MAQWRLSKSFSVRLRRVLAPALHQNRKSTLVARLARIEQIGIRKRNLKGAILFRNTLMESTCVCRTSAASKSSAHTRIVAIATAAFVEAPCQRERGTSAIITWNSHLISASSARLLHFDGLRPSRDTPLGPTTPPKTPTTPLNVSKRPRLFSSKLH